MSNLIKPSDIIPEIDKVISNYIIIFKPKHATYDWIAADRRIVPTNKPQVEAYVATLLKQLDREEFEYQILQTFEHCKAEFMNPEWFFAAFVAKLPT